MVQPKYNPKEALERIKLMMEYDSSKTLSENVEVINEQSTTQVAGAATGAALTTVGTGAALGTTLGTTLGAVGSAVPIVGTAAGIAIGYGLGSLIDWMANKDYGADGFKKVMEACSASGVSKLVPKLSGSEIRQIAYTIEDAKGDWNDDEDAIAAALSKIPTVADLCAVNKKVPGGLYEFLDSVTDSPSEWKMFTRPLAGMIEDTQMVVTPEEKKEVVKKGGNTGGGGGSVTKKVTYTVPTELKDVTGVQKFQDWLDKTHPGWHDKYNTLGSVVSRGYGTFGPRTNKAWNTYKTEYLGGTSVTTNPFAKDTKVSSDDPNNI